MTLLQSYKNMDIRILLKTPNPNFITKLACNITQHKDIAEGVTSAPSSLIKYLVKANHTSVFEHAFITALITNVSRSFLAQITRHRMASYTAASQHYQTYDDYPDIMSEEMAEIKGIKEVFGYINHSYNDLINKYDIPKEEARQILPNSKAVNILWTINARSLINFLNQRLCKRNVMEMFIFATRLHMILLEWWPELFKLIGPDCMMKGYCTQSHMQAEGCKNNGIPTTI